MPKVPCDTVSEYDIGNKTTGVTMFGLERHPPSSSCLTCGGFSKVKRSKLRITLGLEDGMIYLNIIFKFIWSGLSPEDSLVKRSPRRTTSMFSSKTLISSFLVMPFAEISSRRVIALDNVNHYSKT